MFILFDISTHKVLLEDKYVSRFIQQFYHENIMEIYVLKLRQFYILAFNMNFNFDVNIGRAYLLRLFSAFHRLRFPVIGMRKFRYSTI